MDIPATQVIDDDDDDFSSPTQKIPLSPHEVACQVGTLTVNSDLHPINRGINKIGRHPSSDIILNDPTVSKHHAEIEAGASQGSAWICDLHSSNKTRLNNVLLRPGRCYELKDGCTIHFGTVRAIYATLQASNDSFVPETPVVVARKKPPHIIPGTPDSSLNNSSTLMEDISAIPGTQTSDGQTVFLRPSIPSQRPSTDKSAKSLKDSLLDDSGTHSSSSRVIQKDDVSIHDMETQVPLDSSDDIHDVETQAALPADEKNKTSNEIIHDMETQCPTSEIQNVETQRPETDIQNLETQRPETDIQNLETQRPETDIQNLETQRPETDIRNLETQRTETDIQNLETQRSEDYIQHMETQKVSGRSGETQRKENDQRDVSIGEQESVTEEAEKSETVDTEETEAKLDASRESGSPNLLEGFVHYYSPLSARSCSQRSPSSSNNNDTHGKSCDSDNIYEVATQVKETSENPSTDRKFESLIADSDSETDEEGKFQVYKRREDSKAIGSMENAGKFETDRVENIEDSDTDEEGRFAELATRERRSLSSSRADESGGARNSASSRDSDDIFEMATQRASADKREINDAPPAISGNREDISTDIDDTAPTQDAPTATSEDRQLDTVERNVEPDALRNESADERETVSISEPTGNLSKSSSTHEREQSNYEVDDMALTQVVHATHRAIKGTVSCGASPNDREPIEDEEPTQTLRDHATLAKETGDEKGAEDDDVEIDDTLPTQIIGAAHSTPRIDYGRPASREDIDYETAPTQPINEAEEAANAANGRAKNSPCIGSSRRSKRSRGRKTNLDDTLERNLNVIFDGGDDGANDDSHNPAEMSTQVLRDVLQSSRESEESTSKARLDETEKSARDSSSSSSHGERSNSRCVNNNETKVEKKQAVAEVVRATRTSPRRSTLGRSVVEKRTRCNDTVERNLNSMFGDANDEEFAEHPLESTQRLEEILQESQSAIESTGDEQRAKSRGKVDAKKGGGKEKNSSASSCTTRAMKPRIKRLESASESRNSETYFSNLTSSRKRNVIRDSQEFEVSIPRASSTANETTKRCRTKLAKLSQSERGGRSASVDKKSENNNEVNTSVVEKSKTPDRDNFEETLAGLPKVRIAGTLSNPASPSVFSPTIKDTGTSQTTRRTRGRKRAPAKNKLPPARVPDDDGEPRHAINDLPESIVSRTVTNLRSVQLSASSDDDLDYDKIKQLTAELLAANAKYNEKRNVATHSLDVSVASVAGTDEHASSRPASRSVATRNRNASRRQPDDEPSRVFQVAREGSAANVTVGRSTGRRGGVASPPRGEKRNVVATEERTQTVQAKRRKVEEPRTTAAVATRSSRRGKAKEASKTPGNILNYLTRADSPRHAQTRSTAESRNASAISKEASVLLTALPSTTKANCVVTRNKGRSTRKIGASRADSSAVGETITLTSGSGEESQEVEAIMENASVDARNTHGGAASRSYGRTRKRNVEAESTEESVSSDLAESEDDQFEVPAAKPKRARVPRTTRVGQSKEGSRKVEQSRRRSGTSDVTVCVDDSTDGDSQDNDRSGTSTSRSLRSQDTESKKKSSSDRSVLGKSTVDANTSSVIESRFEYSLNASSRSLRNRTSLSNASFAAKTKVLFTGLTGDEYENILKGLGGVTVTDVSKCEILVTDKVKRTAKFLCAVAQAVPIVSVRWLNDSETAGQLLDWENYMLKDPSTEAKFGFKLRASLEKAKRKKLLNGYTVILTPNVSPPPIPELKAMIVSCGGKALIRPPTKWTENAVIISREEDTSTARKFLVKAPKSVTVQSTEFLLTGILKQELDFDKYKLI